MEYLAGFLIFFVGWLILRFLLAASYASGFAEGAWQVTNGGIVHVGELASPNRLPTISRTEIDTESEELGRHLNARNFDDARAKAREFGRDVGRA